MVTFITVNRDEHEKAIKISSFSNSYKIQYLVMSFLELLIRPRRYTLRSQKH